MNRGLGSEITEEAVAQTWETMRGAQGVRPARIVNVEHQQAVGIGHIVLLTIDTPAGSFQFALDPDNAGPAGRRMHELAADAGTGLFIAH